MLNNVNFVVIYKYNIITKINNLILWQKENKN